MNIFRINIAFLLIFGVLVSTGESTSTNQNNESAPENKTENSKGIVDKDNTSSSSNPNYENMQIDTEIEELDKPPKRDLENAAMSMTPPSPEHEIVPESKRQKLDTPEGKSNKDQNAQLDSNGKKVEPEITEIPSSILEFFNNAELPKEDYLDWKTSNKEAENETTPTFKKIFDEIQRHAPFVIQREKYQGIPDNYFTAAYLDLMLLTPNDVPGYQEVKKLKKFFSQTEINDNDFAHFNYYDWIFTSEDTKRLIPSCPEKDAVSIDFPAGKIFKDTAAAKKGSLKQEIADAVAKQAGPNNPLTVPLHKIEIGAYSSDAEGEEKKSESDTTAKPQPEIESTPSQPLAASISLNETSQPNQPSSSAAAESSTAKESLSRSNSSNTKKPLLSSITSMSIRSISDIGDRLRKGGSSLKKQEKSDGTNIVKNKFVGKILKAENAINNTKYFATKFPCEYEVEPTFVKEEIFKNVDAYYAGYMVKFNTKVVSNYPNFLKLSDDMMWFHVAHLMRDKTTKDTFAVFHYSPYYEYVREMTNIQTYTAYTTNIHSHEQINYYNDMYSIDNQREIFKRFKNYEKYFNPDQSLFFVRQELMDQKSVPTMSYKRVALDYMNIAPMYKKIKDTTWRKVENVVLKLPMVTDASTVMFVTGTYGELLINNSPIYLDDGSKDKNKTKRIKVPYAFYKVVHVTYYSPKPELYLLLDHQKFFFNIVIVTHNDPFETNPQKICETGARVKCESIGWKKVVQDKPELGFTYCCAFTEEFANKLGIGPMYHCLDTRLPDNVQLGLLDLNVLWYVEKEKSTCPLGPDEFPMKRKEKPIFETESDVRSGNQNETIVS